MSNKILTDKLPTDFIDLTRQFCEQTSSVNSKYSEGEDAFYADIQDISLRNGWRHNGKTQNQVTITLSLGSLKERQKKIEGI